MIPTAETMREVAKSKFSIDERTTKWLNTTCAKAIRERADDGYLSATIPLFPNLNLELIIQTLADNGYIASVQIMPGYQYQLHISWKE